MSLWIREIAVEEESPPLHLKYCLYLTGLVNRLGVDEPPSNLATTGFGAELTTA